MSDYNREIREYNAPFILFLYLYINHLQTKEVKTGEREREEVGYRSIVIQVIST